MHFDNLGVIGVCDWFDVSKLIAFGNHRGMSYFSECLEVRAVKVLRNYPWLFGKSCSLPCS